jgi:hypothetical protein
MSLTLHGPQIVWIVAVLLAIVGMVVVEKGVGSTESDPFGWGAVPNPIGCLLHLVVLLVCAVLGLLVSRCVR